MHCCKLAVVFIALSFIAIPGQASDRYGWDKNLSLFETELITLKKQNHLPGLSAAIVKDQQLVWSKGFGFADRDFEVPVTADTPFWLASVSKTFVGLAFLHLEAENKIDLDELAAKTPKFSGLCRWLAGSKLPFGRDLRCDAPISLRHILHHQVQGEPGSGFAYNPIMYSRLSRFLEHKLGQGVDAVEGRHNTLAQTIDRTIVKPAGMARTLSSQWDRSKATVFFDMAQGFGVSQQGDWIIRPRPERHIAGGAGVVSTVLDLAKYDIAIDSGLIAPGKIRNQLFAPAKLNNGKNSVYGYGWYVQQYDGETLLWHSGWDEEAGFSALYLKVPSKKLTLILLANGEGLRWGNPLDKAMVENSPFAKAFLQRFIFAKPSK